MGQRKYMGRINKKE